MNVTIVGAFSTFVDIDTCSTVANVTCFTFTFVGTEGIQTVGILNNHGLIPVIYILVNTSEQE